MDLVLGRTSKLTALPGAETNLKHTDLMAKKKASKTPSATAVDRAAPLFGHVVCFEWQYKPASERSTIVDHSRDELIINGKPSRVFIERPLSLKVERRVYGLSTLGILVPGGDADAKCWVENHIAPWNAEAKRRLRYGIREATVAELEQMTDDQKWRYNACANKPVGMHYENFRHEGRVVWPLYLHVTGEIGNGCCHNTAQLCPFPLDASLRGPNNTDG